MSTDTAIKVGTLCYATQQGLGILAKSFYDNGIVTHPFIVGHAHYKDNLTWYPQNTPTMNVRQLGRRNGSLEEYCRSVDVMLFFETPFVWPLIKYCKSIGVKTALMTMYECTPKHVPYEPDVYLCPSELDMDYFPPSKSLIVQVPVDIHKVGSSLRTEARVFVHNAGHGGLKGRNGTGLVIDAWKYVKSPARLLLRSQKALPWGVEDERIVVSVGTVPYEQLYRGADCLVFPEAFNGLSLPLQEGLAAGLVVIAGNRRPINSWLPTAPLVPVSGYRQDAVAPSCNTLAYAIIDPIEIAKKVDEVYAYSREQVMSLSSEGMQWGYRNSWDRLRGYWQNIIKGIKES